MIAAVHILAFIGCIACLIGELKLLAISYHRGFGWLLGCLLFAPLCWLLLLYVDFKSTAIPFVMAMLGFLAALIGGTMAGNI
jgi:hypothetical protein